MQLYVCTSCIQLLRLHIRSYMLVRLRMQLYTSSLPMRMQVGRGGFAAQACRAQALVIGPLTLHNPCIFFSPILKAQQQSKGTQQSFRRQAQPPSLNLCFISLRLRSHSHPSRLEKARSRRRPSLPDCSRLLGFRPAPVRPVPPCACASVARSRTGSTRAGRRADRWLPQPDWPQPSIPFVLT
jgi:hypothetical protein